MSEQESFPDEELTPEQEAEIERLAAEVEREAARVGVDWEAAAAHVRELAAQELTPTGDDTFEVVLSLDMTTLLETLRQLPDGAGTERFLAAFDAADAGEPPTA